MSAPCALPLIALCCMKFSMNTANKKSVSRKKISIEEKTAAIMDFLEGQGALDPEAIALEGAFTERLIVAGATSRRHAQGLAEGLSRLCGERDFEFLGMEGFENAQWILVDCNDVVVNIFQEEARGLYKLEELWARAARFKEEEIRP